MGYFVAHSPPNFCFNLTVKPALGLYRFLKNAYLIGQNQSVSPIPSGLRDTLVKAKQLGATSMSGPPQLLQRGPLFNHHITLPQFAPELQWQILDCPLH